MGTRNVGTGIPHEVTHQRGRKKGKRGDWAEERSGTVGIRPRSRRPSASQVMGMGPAAAPRQRGGGENRGGGSHPSVYDLV